MQTRKLVLDMAILLAACATMFLGVFYFDKGSIFLTKVLNERIAASRNAPSPDGSAGRPRSTRSPTPPAQSYDRVVHLQADRYNQFYADAYINGRPIRVLIDTGASHVALRHEDAESLGIYLSPSDFTHKSRTANGVTRVAPVRLDRIRIGGIEVRNVQAFVGQRGKSFSTLLGMAFLGKLERISMQGRSLELVQ